MDLYSDRNQIQVRHRALRRVQRYLVSKMRGNTVDSSVTIPEYSIRVIADPQNWVYSPVAADYKIVRPQLIFHAGKASRSAH